MRDRSGHLLVAAAGVPEARGARPPGAGAERPWHDLLAERPRRPRRTSAALTGPSPSHPCGSQG